MRIEASAPDARAAAAEARERMEGMGRKPGYSLLLNLTPALLADLGVDPWSAGAVLHERWAPKLRGAGTVTARVRHAPWCPPLRGATAHTDSPTGAPPGPDSFGAAY